MAMFAQHWVRICQRYFNVNAPIITDPCWKRHWWYASLQGRKCHYPRCFVHACTPFRRRTSQGARIEVSRWCSWPWPRQMHAYDVSLHVHESINIHTRPVSWPRDRLLCMDRPFQSKNDLAGLAMLVDHCNTLSFVTYFCWIRTLVEVRHQATWASVCTTFWVPVFHLWNQISMTANYDCCYYRISASCVTRGTVQVQK